MTVLVAALKLVMLAELRAQPIVFAPLGASVVWQVL
jgi:hypothetical protein